MIVAVIFIHLDMIAEITETLGLGLGLDIQRLVSTGLCLKNCSYPSLGLSLDHQEFSSFGLETETDFLDFQSRS